MWEYFVHHQHVGPCFFLLFSVSPALWLIPCLLVLPRLVSFHPLPDLPLVRVAPLGSKVQPTPFTTVTLFTVTLFTLLDHKRCTQVFDRSLTNSPQLSLPHHARVHVNATVPTFLRRAYTFHHTTFHIVDNTSNNTLQYTATYYKALQAEQQHRFSFLNWS
eukprot:2912547-Amphidinium_carterae.3